ncbi:hypothetical protein ACFL04_04390, partial [Patescibacteria group bacterium]
VDVRVGKLELTDTAQLAGDLEYYSDQEAVIASGATVAGQTIYNEMKYDLFGRFAFGVFGATIIFWLISLAGSLAAGIVMVVGLKRYSRSVTLRATGKFWQHLVIGIAVLFLTPIITLILFASVVGALLGVILMALYVLLLLLAGVYAGVIAGAWLFKFSRNDRQVTVNWLSAVVGIIILRLVGLVPFIGWLFGFAFFLVALGALFRKKMDLIQFRAKK